MILRPRVPIAVLSLLAGFAFSAAGAKTVWDGVYTAAQATRGESVYSAECSRCHKDDLSGYRSALIGDRFLDSWREDRLESFFSLVKKTMPRNAPASLSDGEYLDVVAYVLQANAFPAGTKELTADALGEIAVEGKQGPQAVPNYALVEVVGCLAQSSGGEWILTDATEPVRTRDPGDSGSGEVSALGAKAPGPHRFRLLDAEVVRVGPKGILLPKGQRVQAKGFLMRKPGDDSINVTSLQSSGSACVR
jgi:mono/diheme cytochrome c family protein